MCQGDGDPDDSAWTCGMAAGLITGIPTCKELIETLVGTAEHVIQQRLQSLVVPAARI